MTAAFDPSAFIAAEVSRSVAALCSDFAAGFGAAKSALSGGFEPDQRKSVATVATVAAVHVENDNPDLIGNMPWDEHLLPWAESTCPAFIRPEIFDEITNEAVAVSRRWGARAIEAGWSTIDLFGCWRRPQYRRVDCNGLVASIVGLLTPVRVTALTPAHADLTDHLGKVMRFYRRPKPFAVHLWEAYAMPTGP